MATTSPTPARPTGGFSLLDVLSNVQGADGEVVAPSPRPTSHPTGASWIPPDERELTARPPIGDPDDDTVCIVHNGPERTAAGISDKTTEEISDLDRVTGGNHLRREALDLLRELARIA